MTGTELDALVAAELRAMAVAGPAADFARRLAGLKAAPPCAVLFYGSSMRTGDLDGLLDFYVLVERLADWGLRPCLAWATRALPPHVEYHEAMIGGRRLRAKVAVIELAQFDRLTRRGAWNTTIWARFSQPVAIAWARDEASRGKVAALVAQAVRTAAGWAYGLGPARGPAAAFWTALYAHTYRTELRVERGGGRSREIVTAFTGRYGDFLGPAWAELGLSHEREGEGFRRLGPAPAAWRRWFPRGAVGKPLNLARLAKAAYTFAGGPDYLAWKVERHSGVRLDLTPWQKRHPILSAPALLWRLWRRKAIR